MANLDFTSKYTGDLNNEIGLLGNSMNSMSEQLESTINQLQTANEQLKKDIDETIEKTVKYQDFIDELGYKGYFVKKSNNSISISTPYFCQMFRMS